MADEQTAASGAAENTEVSSVASAPEITLDTKTSDVSEAQGEEKSGKENSEEAIKAAVAAYSPNFKFNVHDKEKEFDPWIRDVIKDQETEKKVRELYEKAYGLDAAKPKHEATVKELGELKQNYGTFYNDVREALQYKNIGDLDSFFQKVQLPVEKVAEWMIEKINRQNMAPDQRRVYDERDQRNREAFLYSRQNEDLQQNYERLATQAREAEVDNVLSRPGIHEIAKRYDDAMGSGSFRKVVGQEGWLLWNLTGNDPSAETAINAALNKIGNVWKGQPAAQMPAQAGGEKPLPVIPNVSGKNVSPTRKPIKSIDDIRKLAEEMQAG